MDELDEDFDKFLAKERRKGIASFIFWVLVILAAFAGCLLLAYYIPHLLLK